MVRGTRKSTALSISNSLAPLAWSSHSLPLSVRFWILGGVVRSWILGGREWCGVSLSCTDRVWEPRQGGAAWEVSLACAHCKYLEAMGRYQATHSRVAVVVPCKLWLASGSLLKFRVVYKASLCVSVAACLAFSASPFKMAWALLPELRPPGLVVSVLIACAPHSG